MAVPVPRVGVGVFVFNVNGRFLLGRRKGSHGAGTWALPGGHLEFGETFEQGAEREVMEETGLAVTPTEFLTATNDIMTGDAKHYITIFMQCFCAEKNKEPSLLEPDKCEGWEWVTWKQLCEFAAAEQKSDEPSTSPSAQRQASRHLFSPLHALLEQRPNIIPQVDV